LDQFLSSVERRAYKQAEFAVRDAHSALDIVQDAMIKLTQKYAGKPVSELPMLFQRILQNTIRDYFRRQKVKDKWISLFSAFIPKSESNHFDPLEALRDDGNQSAPTQPDEHLQQSQVIVLIESALKNLPVRQREAFLLRYWEGLNTTETAKVMGCTEGSVKTHCSRATRTLAAYLEPMWVELT